MLGYENEVKTVWGYCTDIKSHRVTMCRDGEPVLQILLNNNCGCC